MTQNSGWYDDPSDSNNLRYWDGVLWTDRTVPKQSPTASSSTIGLPASPGQFGQPPAPYAPAGQSHPGPNPYEPGPSGQGHPGPRPDAQGPSGQTPYGQPPIGRDYGAAPTYQWRPSGPTTPDGVPLAQWWQRLLAALIDGLVLTIVAGVLSFPWLRDFFVWYVEVIQEMSSGAPTTDFATLFGQITDEMNRFIVPITMIQAMTGLVYHAAFLARRGATPGKMALGIRVRRVHRPGPLTLVEALRRSALQFFLSLLALVPIIGSIAGLASYLDQAWLLWDQRRQCLHDKLADTLVEQKPPRT